jgi:signal transduction histidine kinase
VTPEIRADLGRAEPWLRGIGLLIWAFCGLSRVDGLQPWLVPWSLYGLSLLALAWRARFPFALTVALLALQSVCALVLPPMGVFGFEGLFACIVVIQLPLTLSLRATVIWAVAHVPALVAGNWHINNLRQHMEECGAYSTFCAFALAAYWLRLQEQRARAELARSNASLLATRAVLVEGTMQAERLRISRELHDSLGHHLTALSLHLDLAQRQLDGKPAESVTQAKAIAKESLAEVRKVVSTMQHEQGIDLVAALKALAGGIPAPRITIRAPDAVQTPHAVFRCVQEAITNAIRHGAAKNIWVDVSPSPEQLQITVRDDGAGVVSVTKGRGLTGMSERATQLGGSARFESSPGQGFAVHLQVPLVPA